MKKIMKTALSLILGATLLVSAQAIVLDTAEAEEATAVLSATSVSTSSITPGKNILTGTPNALTFTDASDADYFSVSGAGASVTSTDKLYGAGNNALQIACPAQAGNAYWPEIKVQFDTPIERPVAVLFDFHDNYFAFSWGDGNTGYIDDGWNTNRNYNVRKTNVSSVKSLDSLKLGGVVVACTWETYNNYMDNVAVIPYYKVTYDMPAGTEDVVKYVLAADDGNGNIALNMTSDGVISGFATSYTLDETIVADGGANAEFLGWALEDAPATAVTSVALENKDIVLVPIFNGEVEELETYNEQYGEMIFSSDLEGNTYNITNATLLGLLHGGDGVAVTYDGNTGYRGYGLTEGYFYPVTWAQGGGFEFAVPGYASTIRYNAGADVLGTVTVVFNAYNEGTSEAAWWDYFRQPAYPDGGIGWGDLRSVYSCGKAPVGGWNEVVYSNKYIDTPATIIGLSQNGDRRDVVYGDVAVYVKPLNALWLTDANGENRKFELVSGTSFTFPESFNGETVVFWTDGEATYKAGDAATLSAVAGKTFSPVGTTPDVLNVASIRTKGIQGMRFAAFVDDERRTFADSYGFIVARTSEVTDMTEIVFNENGDTSGTNSYGVRYVSGVAYDKDAGIDRVYTTDGSVFGDADLGIGTYFTAVLYNIPAESYNVQLTMRPYIEKNGTYFYGETVTRSIYEVACDIKEGGYRNLDEAGRAYVDSIIDAVK